MAASNFRAGGRATQEGMIFQAGVSVWFAAHMVSDMSVGERFGLSRHALIKNLQCETGRYLDDVVANLSDGGAIFVQCKTHADLTAAADAPLTSTIKQLVTLFASEVFRSGAVDLSRSAAVLAVKSDSPQTLDNLERACRTFDYGGEWRLTQTRMSKAQVRALEIFESAVEAAWPIDKLGPLTSQHLVSLARLFHIARFEIDAGERDWREAANVIGSRLFESAEAGVPALEALSAVVAKLIRNGAMADRERLLRQIRDANLNDTKAPGFDRDIAQLQKLTTSELDRLARHAQLPIGAGLPIPRECVPSLKEAAEGGSLLVIGEPGSGKTGALVVLAQLKQQDGSPVVFLSVDRRSGVRTATELQNELLLQHPLLEVLAAWPGRAPGVLFIDALDASRGGESEGIFSTLIEDAVAKLGDRWSIVASIRTFDLKNGRRFQAAMAGEPPSPEHSEPGLEAVRHYKIPRLTDEEIKGAAQSNQELGKLVASAPVQVARLLRNVFNFSLAAELVSNGVSADSINTAATQSDLIDKYENARLPEARLQTAVAATVRVMVDRRRLAVPKIIIAHEAIDAVLKTGVLTEAEDRVAFAHHVLFDHAAGRFFLDWDDVDRLKAQLTTDPAIGLLLGPAFRFASERVWRDDKPGRPETWRLILDITSHDEIDPVISSVALRTAAERVAVEEDVEGLCALLRSQPDSPGLRLTLSRLSRFVRMSIVDAGSIDVIAAAAWAKVAKAALQAGGANFADGARILLMALSEKADFSSLMFATSFGQAARALLSVAWGAEDQQFFAVQGIQYVAKTFASDPAESRALLQRIIEEPRFSAHAHEEAVWLADGIPSIAPTDPGFCVEIFAVLFQRPAPQDGDSWLGGMPSRIMPLRSSRKQDYEHARWRLGKVFPAFLASSPSHGTRAAIAAAIGLSAERRSATLEVLEFRVGGLSLTIVEDDLTLEEWRTGRRRTSRDGDILASFEDYLRNCTPDEFREVVATAASEEGATSIWVRILGVAGDRSGVADDLLWPIATAPEVLASRGMLRDAVIFISKAYATASQELKSAFESALIGEVESGIEPDRWGAIAGRLLSSVPDSDLATSSVRQLKKGLERDGRLVGNRPAMTIEIGSLPAERMVDRILERDGVNLLDGPDSNLREVSRVLEELLRERKETLTLDQIGALWSVTERVIKVIDENAEHAPHQATLHSSWGSISNAVSLIAEGDAFNPELAGHPSLSTLTSLLDRMWASRYPEVTASDDTGFMSWGNWDVRVYVATSFMAIARRFGDRDVRYIDRLADVLEDPVPAVRLQVVQSLNGLWDIARHTMWTLMDRVAAVEAHSGILGFFIGGPVARIAGPEPERAERYIAEILQRLAVSTDTKESERRSTLHEAVGGLTAQLWVGSGQILSRERIGVWTANLVEGHHYLWHVISHLRGALFLRFQLNAPPDAAAVQLRANETLHKVVAASSTALLDGLKLRSDGEGREAAEELARLGDLLLDHACNQVYFGAGAWKNPNREDPPGLATQEAMRQFLDESAPTLELIGQAGTARTIHHLVELYEYLIEAAPEVVFDRVADLLVGPAARGGYHFESLASDVLVKIVRRYLADYRSVFDAIDRRGKLLRVLELFSSAGWPEALKLLYDLPELLR